MNAYAGLLASGDVRRLAVSSAIARLPAAMLPLAIFLLVVDATASIGAAGLVAGAFGFGRALVSPAIGALIDRVGQTAVLIGGSAVQALLLAALAGAAAGRVNAAVLGGVAFAAGAASPPVQASLRALWPLVTGSHQRDTAYSFDATAQELIWIAGPLAVAAILAVASPGAAVLVSAVIGVAGVVAFATSGPSRNAPRYPAAGLLPGALASPGLAALLGVTIAGGIAWGAQTVGLSALAVEVGQRRSAGVLLALLSLGSIAGGLVYGSRTWNSSVLVRLRVLLVAAAVCGAPLVFASSVTAAIAGALVAGVPLAPLWATSYVLTGRIAPRGAITEAFTWTSSAFALGVALGTGAGGVAGDSAGVGAAFALACLAPLIAWLLTPLLRNRGTGAEPAQAG